MFNPEPYTLDSFKTDSAGNTHATDKHGNSIIFSEYYIDDEYTSSSKSLTKRMNANMKVKYVAKPSLSSGNLIVIKEGTVIGRTYGDLELIEKRARIKKRPIEGDDEYNEFVASLPEPEQFIDPENVSGLPTIGQLVGNYVRIMLRKNGMDKSEEDEKSENVENYMKLDIDKNILQDDNSGETDEKVLEYIDKIISASNEEIGSESSPGITPSPFEND